VAVVRLIIIVMVMAFEVVWMGCKGSDGEKKLAVVVAVV
jgi:hypothetical protein